MMRSVSLEWKQRNFNEWSDFDSLWAWNFSLQTFRVSKSVTEDLLNWQRYSLYLYWICVVFSIVGVNFSVPSSGFSLQEIYRVHYILSLEIPIYRHIGTVKGCDYINWRCNFWSSTWLMERSSKSYTVLFYIPKTKSIREFECRNCK